MSRNVQQPCSINDICVVSSYHHSLQVWGSTDTLRHIIHREEGYQTSCLCNNQTITFTSWSCFSNIAQVNTAKSNCFGLDWLGWFWVGCCCVHELLTCGPVWRCWHGAARQCGRHALLRGWTRPWCWLRLIGSQNVRPSEAGQPTFMQKRWNCTKGERGQFQMCGRRDISQGCWDRARHCWCSRY